VSAGDVPHVVVRAGTTLVEEGSAGLLEAFDELFAEDFEWVSVLVNTIENRTYRGRDGFAEYWRHFMETFGEIEWSDPTYEAVGEDRALCTARFQARAVGSGIPVDVRPAYIFEVGDGRISRARNFLRLADAEEFLAHA
jgi:ketosteroid isomerase-like protein